MRAGRPFFTVITVCLNAREALQRTLQSVAGQAFDDFEHLVIDGQSADGTAELLAAHAQEHCNVRWVSEPDRGLYDAMNKGALLARGGWLNFMNAGDTFHRPDTLAKVADVLRDSPAQVAYGDHEVVYSRYRETVQALPVTQPWVRGRYCHQSAFYRREILQELEYSGEYIASDFEHAFTLYQQGVSFEYLPFTVASFWHDGLNTRHKLRLRLEILRIVRRYDRRPWTLFLLWRNVLWTWHVEGIRSALPPTVFEALGKLKTRMLAGLSRKKISR